MTTDARIYPMTITEFLTARLDEDETDADRTARAVAEVESKRRIVELHRLEDRDPGWKDEGYLRKWPADLTCREGCKTSHHRPLPPNGGEVPCDTLLLLALPYAGHPDYDRAWQV